VADVLLEVSSSAKFARYVNYLQYRPNFFWLMCTLNIALSKSVASEVIKIVTRNFHSVFGKFSFTSCTKNRGACVEHIIWLLGILWAKLG
jgi:CBS domain containing-hemolysin-like protein